GSAVPPEVQLEQLRLAMPGTLKEERATVLELMTELVEIAKLPTEQQQPRLQQLEADLAKQQGLVRLRMPAEAKRAQSCARNQAIRGCAAGGRAVERYGLQHGRCPETLDALVPELLRAVPTDPYDGKPLRYRHDAEGVVVYTVGPDGKDDGGAFATL